MDPLQPMLSSVPESIIISISTLPLPKCIQMTACLIYSQLYLPKIPRKGNRSKILCYCIYQAYIECDMGIVDACSIGIKLGMTSNKSLSAINNRPKYKEGFKPLSPTVTPVKMLLAYIKGILDLPEEITKSMVIIFEDAIITNKHIMKQQIKPLIAAFIMCYMSNN